MYRSAILLLVLVVGCSKASSTTSGKVASCYTKVAGSCREYRDGNLALGTESLAKLCTVAGSGAVFAEAACPTTDIAASCATREGKDIYYTGSPLLDAELETSCTSRGGTFTK